MVEINKNIAMIASIAKTVEANPDLLSDIISAIGLGYKIKMEKIQEDKSCIEFALIDILSSKNKKEYNKKSILKALKKINNFNVKDLIKEYK